MRLTLSTPVEQLFEYAMNGDLSDTSRVNYHEALAVLQFQVLVQQKKAANAQLLVAVATVLLVCVTAVLVVVTP